MKENPIFQSIIKNGLYAGAILAAYFIILYLFNLNFIVYNFITFLVEAIVLLIFAFLSISESRKKMPDNKIKYLPALIAATSVMFMGLIIFGISKLLIFFVIDPEYLQNSINEMILKIKENADVIPNAEEAIDGLNEFSKPSTLLVQISVFHSIKSIVIGALIALVAKKKDRLEESI